MMFLKVKKIIVLLFFVQLLNAQNGTFVIANKSEEGLPIFDLKEVKIYPEPKFKDYEEYRKYCILKKKVIKVYPYAQMVFDRVTKMRERVSKIKSSRLKRKYIQRVQSYFENEFTDDIENMTQTEGQILAKLIYREVGITMYEIISEFRSGWTAFWWNSTAWFFNVSLKVKYDKENDQEDKMIEGILQRAIATGDLNEKYIN